MSNLSRRRTTRVDLATTYAAEDNEEIVVPEDLSTLSDEDLAALSERAEAAFDALYQDGEADLSTDEIATLRSLTEAITRVNAEIGGRDEAAEARRAEAAELAASIRPAATNDDPEGGAGDEDPDPNADPHVDEVVDAEVIPDDASALVDEEQAALVAGAAQTQARPLSISVRSAKARQPRQQTPAPAKARTVKDIAFATTDTLGFGMNAAIDFHDAGKMLDNRLASFALGQYQGAQARNQHMRETSPLMAIKRPIPRELVVGKGTSVDDAMSRAVDQTRLPGGALTAAGWCSPSDNMYDLVYDSSRDGLLSIPEVGVGRGGINVPVSPTFADVYNSIGFHFTEAQAAAGEYAPGGAGTARANSTAVTLGQVRTLNGLVLQVVTAGTTAASAPSTTGLQVGQTLTDGTATWRRIATVPNIVGDKPCFEIECPDWEDYRLEGDGLCIIADILMMRGYPEMLAMVTSQALVAHDHKVSAGRIAKLVAGSTNVLMTTGTVGTTAPLLAAIELQVEHYRYTQRLSRNTLLEGVFPYWVHGAIRQDLSVRLGLALFDVTNEQIDAWFRLRGLVPQYVYDWQALDGFGAAGTFKTWPTTVSFLLYQAGTWVGGVDDIITLSNLYDSTMLGQNKFTALFTEEAWLVAKRGTDSRLVTVPVMSDGSVHAGVLLDGNLVGV